MKARDPEMCETRDGEQWYFGMEAHVGIETERPSRSMRFVATRARVHDAIVLLHGAETRVWGDEACRGQTDAIRAAAPDLPDDKQIGT